ncbi:hypothetical protein P154DRAFT_521102 [Amniculicola lignicola CBS 123094]|uniref:Cyanovirin-N domain-containing protein n=1 Tax=Amniculicola lignicola CBS 123094 TaxID=1392246 RepID=A0A6A5WKA5_9PLEO|nr:hypothetical protein P154DRAFT_521102 [Amniculicola lignicola CBS 123094]
MKISLALFIFGLGAQAAMVPKDSKDECCFSLKSMGDLKQDTFQDANGLLHLHTPEEHLHKKPSKFCLNKVTNALKDDQGRKCYIDKKTKHFKCNHGFSDAASFIGEGVHLFTEKMEGLVACPSRKGQMNLFVHHGDHANECKYVALKASEDCLPQKNGDKKDKREEAGIPAEE